MKYYENHDDERTERIWELCIKIILVMMIIAAVAGFFIIDFEEIDNNIKIERNE